MCSSHTRFIISPRSYFSASEVVSARIQLITDFFFFFPVSDIRGCPRAWGAAGGTSEQDGSLPFAPCQIQHFFAIHHFSKRDLVWTKLGCHSPEHPGATRGARPWSPNTPSSNTKWKNTIKPPPELFFSPLFPFLSSRRQTYSGESKTP